jgi:hypothetical protein
MVRLCSQQTAIPLTPRRGSVFELNKSGQDKVDAFSEWLSDNYASAFTATQ